jgi:hypothetical protein
LAEEEKAMSRFLKLADAAPIERSAARIVLAAAIERHAEATRELAANEAAQLKAEAARGEAADAVERAQLALEEAKSAAAKHLTRTIMGTAGDAPQSIKDARAALTDATDSLEVAGEAFDALVKERPSVAQEVSFAQFGLRDKLRDLVRSDLAVKELVERYTELHRRAVDVRRALELLDRNSMIPDEFRGWNVEREWPDLQAAASWRAAISALESDADAPLPIAPQAGLRSVA